MFASAGNVRAVTAIEHQPWLDASASVERISLDESSWVDVVRGFVPRADEVHDELVANAAWEQGRVFRYERWIDDPRLSSWQAGSARHPALVEAGAWISRRYRVRFEATLAEAFGPMARS